MRFLDYLFGKKRTQAPCPPKPAGAGPVYLTQMVVFGKGDSSVFFIDENRGIRKELVSKDGTIRCFPGIVREPFWTCKVSSTALLPRIRYRTDFERRGDQWRMLWQVQPDGAYWADSSGYGMGKEEEVILYTYVDNNGDFTGPFRIYSVGDREYAQ